MNPTTEQRPMVENISCIIPQTAQLGGLFLGNVYGAQNADILKQYGIRAIITTSAQTKINHDFEDIPFHLVFEGHDKEDYYISEHVNSCIHFIQQHRKFTNVLVHCYAGVSRSSAIICSYLMWKYRWNLNKTLAFVVFKRIVAKPNDGFMKQLRDVEAKLNITSESNIVQQRTNVQKILSPNGSRVRQDSIIVKSQSRPSSSMEVPPHIQKSQSPPPMFESQKMNPFAYLNQINQMNQMNQHQQVYYTQPYTPPQNMNGNGSNYSQYNNNYYQTRQQQAPGLERTVYKTKKSHNDVPIPRVLSRKSQYEKAEPRQQPKRHSIYNDYMSPPMSPRSKFNQKMSLGKTNYFVSPGKGTQQMYGSNYRQTQASVYSTNYSKKTYDSMQKSKTMSRCLIRPRDLPGYKSNHKNY